jgi:hypothetical protein
MKAGTDTEQTERTFVDFHVTVRGASHLRKGTVCQDFSRSAVFGDAAAAAVADGHGDVRYFRSAAGSRFAAEAAMKAMKEFVRRESAESLRGGTEEKFSQLKKNIILNWNRRVAAHYEKHPFLEAELEPLSEHRRGLLRSGKLIETAYGTTLIAAVIAPGYWFGLQIGDGDCFALSADGEETAVPKEEGLVGNVTTSLCEPDAFYRFHHVFGYEVPAAVVMSTDGVRNSFSNGLHFRNFMGRVASEFAGAQKEKTELDLKEFLAEMTKRGSGDDLSVAGIVASSLVRSGSEPALYFPEGGGHGQGRC